MKNIKHFTTTSAYNTYIGTAQAGYYVSKVDDVTAATAQIKYDKVTNYDGFFLQSIEDGSTVSHDKTNTEYSLDGGDTWTAYTAGTTLTVNSGGKVCFRADSNDGAYWNEHKFTMTGKFNAGGNICTLLKKTNYHVYETGTIFSLTSTVSPNVGLFNGCTSLYDASNMRLPATNINNYCYYGLFKGCTNLTGAPEELPATTLESQCYYNMFYGCTSLTTAPIIYAQTLSSQCCVSMFDGCSSLNYVKCLATDISAVECTAYWLSAVASTGQLVVPNSMRSAWDDKASLGMDAGKPTNWTYVDA